MSLPGHVAWIVDTGKRITTADGAEAEVWELQHTSDVSALQSWASHFRRQYCSDNLIDVLRSALNLSRSEFLLSYKFPHHKTPPGPSTRSGDFAEILVSDLLEFREGYWCPREFRYDSRINPNDSAKGVDVLAFKMTGQSPCPTDELVIVETKAALTGKPVNRLQKAVDDSIKDKVREGMSLNALRQRFAERGDAVGVERIGRFQNENDLPFTRVTGAAAVHSKCSYDETLIATTTTTSHPNAGSLRLIVISGDSLMNLAHALYDRAANEA